MPGLGGRVTLSENREVNSLRAYVGAGAHGTTQQRRALLVNLLYLGVVLLNETNRCISRHLGASPVCYVTKRFSYSAFQVMQKTGACYSAVGLLSGPHGGWPIICRIYRFECGLSCPRTCWT